MEVCKKSPVRPVETETRLETVGNSPRETQPAALSVSSAFWFLAIDNLPSGFSGPAAGLGDLNPICLRRTRLSDCAAIVRPHTVLRVLPTRAGGRRAIVKRLLGRGFVAIQDEGHQFGICVGFTFGSPSFAFPR